MSRRARRYDGGKSGAMVSPDGWRPGHGAGIASTALQSPAGRMDVETAGPGRYREQPCAARGRTHSGSWQQRSMIFNFRTKR